jgi:SAM-dependent methyltransferase
VPVDPRTVEHAAYTREYYAAVGADAQGSALVILPAVFAVLDRPTSVIDVGCGTGEWLAQCARLGTTDVVGVDQVSYHPSMTIRRSAYRQTDLERGIAMERDFDLALCLEVAEHLSLDGGRGLVKDLTKLADVVLFSGAIPGQGGLGHRTERWQSFWAAEFGSHGFRPLDFVRSTVWMDQRVQWWYAQNTVLYVAASKQIGAACGSAPMILDLVHPENYARGISDRHAMSRGRGSLRRQKVDNR